MLHAQSIRCIHCASLDLVKHGHSPNGTQRCNSCRKTFRLSYRYTARQKGIREKIIEMTLNGSGVRDTGSVLGISKDTVCSTLKKTLKKSPYFLTTEEKGNMQHLEIEIGCSREMDEFWSYVQKKANQRWTWYAIDKRSGCILEWHNGKRKDEDFPVLVGFIEILPY